MSASRCERVPRPAGRGVRTGGALAGLLALAACREAPGGPEGRPGGIPSRLPAILLVTLDTTRADALEPEGRLVPTPAFAALAARGLRFAHAYTTAPMTLPAHASMLTGLYPAGHRLHENGRRLPEGIETAAERLAARGFATAAFVSGYPLERQFGLARGFSHYDDGFSPGRLERRAEETTDRALGWLAASTTSPSAPLFVWVHYYDPHEPYDPPSPERERHPDSPYHAEVAAMDRALGRLVAAFEHHVGSGRLRVLVVADHGEGLGDHGERLHGNLLYQSTLRVPLLVIGPGVAPGLRSDPVSVRQVFATLLAWAGEPGDGALRPLDAPPPAEPQVVIGEAMQPFLQYRWQPLVAAVGSGRKVIQAGSAPGGLEVYNLESDPGEARNLAAESPAVARELRLALREYPLPAAGASAPLDEEARRQLASLGYLAGTSGGTAPLPPDAPRPAAMTPLFDDLDRASRAFGEERYREAMPLLARLRAADPGNPMIAVRLAVCHSLLGDDEPAVALFRAALRLAPDSADARHYYAMHEFLRRRYASAEALFEDVLRTQPDREAALDRLAAIRERQARFAEAADLLERAAGLARHPAPLEERLGLARMALGDTPRAIAALESARRTQGEAFRRQLELGVLYLAARRPAEAAEALDAVPADHPEIALALFKRAQASVLLGEADRAARVRTAWLRGTPETRSLIEAEKLFAGLLPPPG